MDWHNQLLQTEAWIWLCLTTYKMKELSGGTCITKGYIDLHYIGVLKGKVIQYNLSHRSM